MNAQYVILPNGTCSFSYQERREARTRSSSSAHASLELALRSSNASYHVDNEYGSNIGQVGIVDVMGKRKLKRKVVAQTLCNEDNHGLDPAEAAPGL